MARIPIQFGVKVVCGIPKEIKPIIGLPEGRAKLRLRNTNVGRVFVRTANGVERFILLDKGETWGVAAQGVNRRMR